MTDLGQQEAAVLDCISRNPFAGQQELADTLGLARSTVAAHVSALIRKGYILGRGYVLPGPRRAVCLGGAVLDRKYRALGEVVAGTSNPVEGHRSFGGVARNVAETLAALGVQTSFVTAVGDDEGGRQILDHLQARGVDVSRVQRGAGQATAEYAAILDAAGELVLGIADMAIFDTLTPDALARVWPHLAGADRVFCDCNLPAETLAGLITRARGARFRLAIDAVSTHKVRRLPEVLEGVDLMFLNLDEAGAVLGARPDSLRAAAAAIVARGAAQALVSDGPRGIAVADASGVRLLPAVPARPVDITGAGDAMIAGTLYRLFAGDPLSGAARVGALLGALATECPGSVIDGLSATWLADRFDRLPAAAS
ncbi:winged helix-turn-helix transcriptional regulator (plasmid) [Paroceanicella profunda]|uniref:Winged helix-turn-helix transcriptional regulator n=1 Tax=Paroceanicella profunda TaxID=2579971 RepID=A0A5B8G5T0_9RHOB|nr:carbohydrate kinase [Paroceanicella profunda]QDL94393.1 winged helix-turn-helix transcriptional regulator [Paroceanicella profunda]